MKQPGPDHPITIAPATGQVRVVLDGAPVADSANAVVLREAAYRPVFYIPRADIDMARLHRTTQTSHCPYKGDAAYFAPAPDAQPVAWSYEQPFPAMEAIAGHLAFYPDRVDAIEAPP